MSFLTKYQDYGLNDNNLLGWYRFYDLSDSGPNSNNLNNIGPALSLSSPPAVFNGNLLEIPCGDQKNFSAFISLGKTSNSEASILVSNYGTSGYYLGYTANFDFFIYAKSASNSFIKFYKNIKAASTCILILSRNDSEFSLSIYSPFSKRLTTESICVPLEIDLGSSTTKIGLTSFSSPFAATSKFNIYEFGIINVSVPNFVLTSLCNELFISAGYSLNNFMDSFVSVKNKTATHHFQPVSGNNEFNTGIILPFSPIISGFPLLNNTVNGSGTFYRNNSIDTPTLFSSYVRFSGQSENDRVIWDNFGTGVSTGLSVNFTGSVYQKTIPNKPILFKGSSRQTKDFVTLDSGNLCYGKNIIFENKSNLLKI